MSTVWVRLNAVVFFGLSVLLTLSSLAALSKQFTHEGKPIVSKLELNRIRSLKPHGGADRALFSFDLDVDLGPAFHWNVHQLFVYVVARYETESAAINHVVIWDSIVPAAAPVKILHKKNADCKYALVDPAKDLRGRNITLQLQWDHMPTTGILYVDQQSMDASSSFLLPSEYQ